MSVAWTEAFSSFVPAGTGWSDYNLFSNKSVPKGAIAYVLMVNSSSTANRTIGLRTDGSSLARSILINKATSSGSVGIGMYVRCHPTTGLIETYADNTTGVTFYLMGWWSGADFTERMDDITDYGGALEGWTWNEKDIYTGYSIPKGSVVSLLCLNLSTAGAVHLGARTSGSAIDRAYYAAPSTSSTSCVGLTMQVKSDATVGKIEAFKGASGGTLKFYITGYFDSSMDYVETELQEGTSSASWNDFDVTSYLDQDGRVVDSYATHYSTSANHALGARINGSSLSRYLSIRYPSAGYEGYMVPTKSDGSGIIEFYNSPTGDGYHFISGYYKDGAPSVIEISTTDAASISYEAVSIDKVMVFNDALSASNELVSRDKVMSISCFIGLSEEMLYEKVLAALYDAVDSTDSNLYEKILGAIIDSLQGVDSNQYIKVLGTVTDGVSSSDENLYHKYLSAVAEALTSNDTNTYHKYLAALDDLIASSDEMTRPFRGIGLDDATGSSDEDGRPLRAFTLGDLLNGVESLGMERLLGPILESILADDSLSIPAKGRIIADVLNISESILKAREFSTEGDAVVLAESLIKGRSFSTESEYVQLVENLVKGRFLASLPDSVTIVDALEKARLMEVEGDIMFLGDSVGRPVRAFTVTDAVILIDALVKGRYFGVEEPVALIESPISRDKIIAMDEELGTSDDEIRDRMLSEMESLGLIDSALRDKLLALLDSTSLQDATVRDKALAVSDALAMIETILKGRSLPLSDEVRSSDTWSVDKDLTAFDGVALVEALDVLQSGLIALADALSLVERISTDKGLLEDDAASISDGASFEKAKRLDDLLAMADAVAVVHLIIVSDMVRALDAVVVYNNHLYLGVDDSIRLEDVEAIALARIIYFLTGKLDWIHELVGQSAGTVDRLEGKISPVKDLEGRPG
jgi:hypothetical protein